jgi:predicted SnoaL-like aldol condensation-catalyzing enzyme
MLKYTVLPALMMLAALPAHAQVPVEGNPNHDAMLASPNPVLAANKRLVYDFQREVLEGGHLELADKYLAENYIQHNPNVPTGRAGFVQFFSQFSKPGTIEARVKAPVVSVTAEGDIVVISYRAKVLDPANDKEPVTTTWFDMFRIENGKLAEHWDPSPKG